MTNVRPTIDPVAISSDMRMKLSRSITALLSLSRLHDRQLKETGFVD
ncbi:MAG TPA: hypothetical protein VF389_02785 [Woeseiaceae bacterium]